MLQVLRGLARRKQPRLGLPLLRCRPVLVAARGKQAGCLVRHKVKAGACAAAAVAGACADICCAGSVGLEDAAAAVGATSRAVLRPLGPLLRAGAGPLPLLLLLQPLPPLLLQHLPASRDGQQRC